MHNTSHEFGFVVITNQRSLKVISEIIPRRTASSSASSWLIAVECYVGWRISSYFVKMMLFALLVVSISAGVVENSENSDSHLQFAECVLVARWRRVLNVPFVYLCR